MNLVHPWVKLDRVWKFTDLLADREVVIDDGLVRLGSLRYRHRLAKQSSLEFNSLIIHALPAYCAHRIRDWYWACCFEICLCGYFQILARFFRLIERYWLDWYCFGLKRHQAESLSLAITVSGWRLHLLTLVRLTPPCFFLSRCFIKRSFDSFSARALSSAW